MNRVCVCVPVLGRTAREEVGVNPCILQTAANSLSSAMRQRPRQSPGAWQTLTLFASMTPELDPCLDLKRSQARGQSVRVSKFREHMRWRQRDEK